MVDKKIFFLFNVLIFCALVFGGDIVVKKKDVKKNNICAYYKIPTYDNTNFLVDNKICTKNFDGKFIIYDNIIELPIEILQKIMSVCDLESIGRLNRTCSKINSYGIIKLSSPIHYKELWWGKKSQINKELQEQNLNNLFKAFELENGFFKCSYILSFLSIKANGEDEFKSLSELDQSIFDTICSFHAQEIKRILNSHHNLTDSFIQKNYIECKDLLIGDYRKNAKDYFLFMFISAIQKNQINRVKHILQYFNWHGSLEKVPFCHYFNKASQKFTIDECIRRSLIKQDKNFNDKKLQETQQEMIEFILTDDKCKDLCNGYDIWENLVLNLYHNRSDYLKDMIDFLMSKKFKKYTDEGFSYHFFLQKNGFFSVCKEEEFDDLINYWYENKNEYLLTKDRQIALSDFYVQKNVDFTNKKIMWIINNFYKKWNAEYNEKYAWFWNVWSKAFDESNEELMLFLMDNSFYDYGHCSYEIFECLCKNGKIDFAQRLIKEIINKKTSHLSSCMSLACKYQYVNIVKDLLKAECVNEGLKDNIYFHWALQNDNPEPVLNLLLNNGKLEIENKRNALDIMRYKYCDNQQVYNLWRSFSFYDRYSSRIEIIYFMIGSIFWGVPVALFLCFLNSFLGFSVLVILMGANGVAFWLFKIS